MRVLRIGHAAFASLFVAVAAACGSASNPPLGSENPGLGAASTDDAGGSGGSSGAGGGSSSGFTDTVGTSTDAGGGPCPAGFKCNVSCSGGATTSISGTVYDPAGRDPLYDIVVYVPAKPLTALPKGVPTGSAACSCPALYPSGEVVTTTTGVNGTFTLSDAPVGTDVPLVIQVGKWRRLFHVNTTACKNTAVPDKTLLLPSTIAAGDTNDNMPDIAVSTGSADTLECLMLRIGLPASEYVAGAGGSGHVHVFAGGSTGGGAGGTAETPGMSGAPPSPTSLWMSQAQLMPYDVVLLSCEGGETYNANPQALEAYLDVGGRAFGSHYHYAWFSGPIGSGQTYTVPADWGTCNSNGGTPSGTSCTNNLSSWEANGNGGGGGGFLGFGGAAPIGGTIVTTLNGSTMPFAKGVALDKWLGVVGALGQNGVASTELSIYQPRYNSQVGPANKPSQPWITSSPWTLYFSFDTPVGGLKTDGGTGETSPSYCGRAVFSDLHVGGDPVTTDNSSPPGGCYTGDLSPQEKALEFMLFDLSSCVIPDTVPPSTTGPAPQ
jgi:hypothetical protein